MNTGRKTARGARAGEVQSRRDERQGEWIYVRKERGRGGILWCACPSSNAPVFQLLSLGLLKVAADKNEILTCG